MSEPQFPPSVKPMSVSARMAELETCKFLSVRKAVTDTYRNPDKTPLLTYGETLNERGAVRQKVIEYELAQGWLVPDGTPGAVSAPVTATPAVVEPVPPPTGVPFMPQQQPAPASQQMIEATAPTEMVTTRARRAKPNLGTGMAPPPVSLMPSPVTAPPPPPGATVLNPPPGFVPAIVQQQQTNPPFIPSGPLAAPVVQVAPTATNSPDAVLMGLTALIDKVDDIGKGLTSISKQSEALNTKAETTGAQILTVNKTLESLQRDLAIVMAAVHHIYTATDRLQPNSNGKISTIIDFKNFISAYLPQ